MLFVINEPIIVPRFVWAVFQDGKKVFEDHNLVTNAGRKASVGLWFGAGVTPQYLGLDKNGSTIASVTTTSAVLTSAMTAHVGDTLTLSIGTANQEVTSPITSISGNTYYWATATTLTHSAGDGVTRSYQVTDTGLVQEQPLATGVSTRRVLASATGVAGSATASWFYSSTEAQFIIYGLGTWDNANMGSGTLWNAVPVYIVNNTAQMTTVQVQVTGS